MSHSVFGGLHRADLISAEDKRATRNNMLHVTDAAENCRQSAYTFSNQGWYISSFKRQTCPGIKHTEWGLPHWATTKISVHITQPCYISLLVTQHKSEVYMTLQGPCALFFTSWRQDLQPASLASCSDQQWVDSHCMWITPETLFSVIQHKHNVCSLDF